jgi:hypothetical protein
VVDAQAAGAHLRQRRPAPAPRAARQVALQAVAVALQRVHVAQHEADRVVQLVRHAGHQAAQRGHLLGMQQLLLGALERLVRLAQLVVGALDLAHRPADEDMAHAPAGGVEAAACS